MEAYWSTYPSVAASTSAPSRAVMLNPTQASVLVVTRYSSSIENGRFASRIEAIWFSPLRIRAPRMNTEGVDSTLVSSRVNSAAIGFWEFRYDWITVSLDPNSLMRPSSNQIVLLQSWPTVAMLWLTSNT